MDVMTDGRDGEGRASEWLTPAEAAKVLGRTERTIRRYITGEIQPPGGVEFSSKDGRVLVRVTDGETRQTDLDGRRRTGVNLPKEGVLAELEATRNLLQDKEIVITRLESQLAGKEELLQAREDQIEQLRDTQAHHQVSIERMEILLNNLQKALPALSGEPGPGESPAGGERTPLPRKWFLALIVILLLAASGIWYWALLGSPEPIYRL